MTEKDLTTEQITAEIANIQNRFGFRSQKMCEMLKMKYQTYRNNLNPNSITNHFKFIHLIRLKSEIAKLVKNYNDNENNNSQTTTNIRRSFANNAFSDKTHHEQLQL